MPRRRGSASSTRCTPTSRPGPDWPNVGFDFRPVMERINARAGQAVPGLRVRHVHGQRARSRPRRSSKQDKAGGIDGYLVYQMNCWNRVVQTIAATGKPVLYADFQYGGSGGFLVYTAGFLRGKAPERRLRRLVADRGPGRGGEVLRAGQEGRLGGRFRGRHGRACARSGRPKPGDLACKPDDLEDALDRGMPAPDEGIEDPGGAAVARNPAGRSHDHGHPGGQRAVRRSQRRLEGGRQGRGPRQSPTAGRRPPRRSTASSRETLETLGRHVPGQEGRAEEARRQRHHDQLPGRLLRRAHPRLSVPGLPRAEQRGAGGRVRVRRALHGHHGRDDGADAGPAGLHLRPGHRHRQAADHLRPLRGLEPGFGPQGEANPFQILTHSEDRQGARSPRFPWAT